MASSGRMVWKLSSGIQALSSKVNKKAILKSASHSPSRLSRLPVELSCLQTMLPLHTAIASARLNSSLSIHSQSWGLVPQGISMPQ